MRILIIHQNFPGQFRHVAKAWSARADHEVVAIGHEGCPGLPGVRVLTYKLHRRPVPQQHHYLQKMESAVLHGQAVARLLLDLKRQGFRPDVILAHPGWGETLYAKDVFPDCRLIHFCEWFYGSQGSDVGFDPEFPASFDDHARIRSWNALHLLNLENCDAGISPTEWQRSRHPVAYQSKITVAHEGIDTALLGPDPKARITLASGVTLKAGDPVITYVARNLEPYRGFHVFMRALEKIQAQHKSCHAVIVGGDDVSYGRRPTGAKNWREKMLEAMASGCLVIGSRTAPVEEVVRDGENARLVDFFEPEAVASVTVDALERAREHDVQRREGLRDARARFGRTAGLLAYDGLLARNGR